MPILNAEGRRETSEAEGAAASECGVRRRPRRVSRLTSMLSQHVLLASRAPQEEDDEARSDLMFLAICHMHLSASIRIALAEPRLLRVPSDAIRNVMMSLPLASEGIGSSS
jgi:hypothetical protein